VLGLAKSSWYALQQRQTDEGKYGELRIPLMEIAERHPEYGYRRTTAELRESGRPINHKVVERLHRHWNLSVMRRIRHPKPNPIAALLKKSGSKINLVAQLGDDIEDLKVFYTDFTEIIYQRGRAKAQLIRDLFFEQEDLESLKKVVEARIRYYNFERKHSALGNLSPMKYLKKQGLKTR